MKTIRVNVSSPYDVIIENGSIRNSGKYISDITNSKRTVIITDDIVGNLYCDTITASLSEYGISSEVFVFPNGEGSKNIKVLSNIYDFLCEKNVTRSDIIIALGGGVVGDITGFAAATYLRGIDFVQIPTTLLAQIDSSVGGKTAIDLSGGKNLVGAFKQPKLVICDPEVLSTLSDEILSDGMAEAIKYGMIYDSKLFELIESHDLSNVSDVIDKIIYTCVDIKRQVVEEDEFDTGKRMILNFGHTIGHAIEGWHNYTDYTHGKGVAAGMCYITRRFADNSLADRLEKCVKSYALPCCDDADISKLLPFCKQDKKRQSDNINYIVCEEVGKAEIRKSSFSEFCSLMGGKS